MQPPAQILAPNVANATCLQFIIQVLITIESFALQTWIVLREQVVHHLQPNPIFESAKQASDRRGTPSIAKAIPIARAIPGRVPC